MPGIRHVRSAANNTRRAYYRRFGRSWLKRKLAASPSKRIVIGAWSRFDPGWIPTQREFFDLTDPTHWAGTAGPRSGPDGNSMNHRALYTYRTLGKLFESAGFRVVTYEYFDEEGSFDCQDWDAKGGTIWRSERLDPRNKRGKRASVYPGTVEDCLAYSSLILDAVKDRAPGT
jgi:predicted SAM-dependent methyltransferase